MKQNRKSSIQYFYNFFSLSVLCVFVVNFTCCQNTVDKPTTTMFVGNAMTIDYKIIVGGNLDPEQHNAIEAIIKNTFSETDSIYNKWNPRSELSELNRLKSKVVHPISQKLEKFLQLTNEIVTMTYGRFDPTIEPIQQLWKTNLALGKIPTKEEIQLLAPAVGWDKIHIYNGLFYKDNDSTALDLGGIAKGYCVDLLIENLNAAGYPNLYVEWGGEIRCSGHHPDGRPWRIFISNLGDTQQKNALAEIDLTNEAIATSGDYLQNWKHTSENDVQTTYFHIFDPTTHLPLVSTSHSIASASVVGPSCALADGLATAAMTFDTIEEAEEWTKKIQQIYPSVRFWFIMNHTKK